MRQCCFVIHVFARTQAFDICPETYLLPREHAAFLASFHGGSSAADSNRHRPSNVWITKPVAASRGRGIAVTDSLRDIEAGMAEAPIIVQVCAVHSLGFCLQRFLCRLF